MPKTWIVILVLGSLLCAWPTPAAEPTKNTDPRLIGTWHTVSIDGDALFLVIDGVEVDLDADGNFTAKVRFTDGQTEMKRGRYEVRGDRITFSLPSLKSKESGTYKIEGKDLIFHDDSFGVSVTAAKGKATDSAGLDLF